MSKIRAFDCGLDGLTFNDPSLCKPHFAAECDLALIVKRFLKTGQLPQFAERPTIESDEGYPTDLFELQQTLIDARAKFDSLPLEVRNRFNNDPSAFFESVADQAEATPAEASEASKPVSEVSEPVVSSDPQ